MTTCAGSDADVRFVETAIAGVVVVELEEHVDERGSFARTWCRDEMTGAGLTGELAQCSLSRNPRAGTLRGLHFQRTPPRRRSSCGAAAVRSSTSRSTFGGGP